MLSRSRYLACGQIAMAIVRHAKDRRSYYMCEMCADHNVKNRGAQYAQARPGDPVAPTSGDNQPDQFTAFKIRVEELMDAVKAWAEVNREIASADVKDRAEGFLTQVQKELKAAEAQRKIDNAPHKAAIEVIDARYKPLTTRLQAIVEWMKPRILKWLDDEKARLAAITAQKAKEAAELQEKARAAQKALESGRGNPVEAAVHAQEMRDQAAEAIAARDEAATAKPQAKSEFSTRARSAREIRRAEIVNIDEAFKVYRLHPDVNAVLTKLASADFRRADGPAAIPGCKLVIESTLS